MGAPWMRQPYQPADPCQDFPAQADNLEVMRRSRGGRVLAIAVGAVGVLGLGTAVGLVLGKRLKTGSWSVPTGDDLVRIDRSEEGGPPRVIYLHRGPITLTGGEDDAVHRISSVVARLSVFGIAAPEDVTVTLRVVRKP